MTLVELDLTVIAVCSVLVTLGVLTLVFVSYRLLRKMEESVDTVNNQLRPAVIELKRTILSLTEAFKIVNDFVNLTKRLRRKKD
ncbi:MAG: hypothetical protein ABGX12_02210 [Desulfurobacteriaceae bacterium]